MLIVSNSQCRSTRLQRKVLALVLALKAWSLLTSLVVLVGYALSVDYYDYDK